MAVAMVFGKRIIFSACFLAAVFLGVWAHMAHGADLHFTTTRQDMLHAPQSIFPLT
jgi:hypothetical protein